MARNKKHKSTPLILATLLGSLALLTAKTASAADMGWGEKYIVLPIIKILLGGVFSLTGIAAGMGGKLLDLSIHYSLEIKTLYTEGIVLTGWKICRDVANLGFVFILIFIGIATILQLQTYSYKRLLVGVLVAALLVNFSMTITLMIIDASNVIAMEFLCKASTNEDCSAKGMAEAISRGIGYSSITGSENEQTLLDNADTGKIAIIYILGSIVLIVVTFVFGAIAFMFLGRTIVLMLLIMFSPLAFVAMAIKSGLAKKWWKTLLNQCFFAPISLFFLYLISKYYGDGGFQDFVNPVVNGERAGFQDLVSKPGGAETPAIVAQFVLSIALLVASMIVSKQMGAYGASGAINLGNKWRKSAVGYAGNISKRTARRAAGSTASAFASGEAPEGAGRISRATAWAGRRAQRIPIAGPAMARQAGNIAAANRAQMSKLAAKYEKYTSQELRNMVGSGSSFRDVAILSQIQKKEGTVMPDGRLTREQITRGAEKAARYGTTISELKPAPAKKKKSKKS